MRNHRVVNAFVGSMALLCAVALAAQEPAEQEPAGSLEALDREVAAYPAEQQAAYAVFRAKCSTCHTIHRAVSADVEDWATKVRKMARKQGSGISADHARVIADFLDYRSDRRRPAKPEEPKKREEFPQVTFGGSIFGDASALVARRGERDTMVEEGMTSELSICLSAAVSRRITVGVSACYGCHSLEVDQAYGEYRLSDSVALRAGRFPVPLGAVHQRYVSSNREGASKPLPYIMGMMPHGREFNQGVVPAPLVDNGIALSGDFWAGADAQLGATVYGVRGLKGGPIDFDYISSREIPDNNGEPAGGMRLTFSWGALALGASYMEGDYDIEGDLGYRVGGGDLRLMFGEVTFRAEVLRRDTEYLTAGPGSAIDDYVKEGYVLQIDAPVPFVDGLQLFVMQDGLSVRGIYLGPFGPTAVPSPATTDDRNTISRWVAGVEYVPSAGVVLKASAERWSFSDFADTWVYHLGAAFLF